MSLKFCSDSLGSRYRVRDIAVFKGADEFFGSIVFDPLQRGIRDIKQRKADGYECDDEA